MPDYGPHSAGPPLPDASNRFLADHVSILRSSFHRLGLGDLLTDLPADEGEAAQLLFEAPFALASHNTAPDPIFNYGNRKALELFAMEWDDFVRLPSRLSAEPVNQVERDRLLAAVRAKGYIADYRGVRIAATGRRFMIENAVVWNLSSPSGLYHGQAACFVDWRFL